MSPRDRSRLFKILVQPGASRLYVPPDDKNPEDSEKEGEGIRRRKGKGGGEKAIEKVNEGVVQGVGESNATQYGGTYMTFCCPVLQLIDLV
jgi:hypothetical protein